MDSILFDSYRKFQKSKKNNIIKAIFKMPVFAICLLGIIVLCVLFSVSIIFMPSFSKYYVYCLVLEVLTCVVLYFYTEHFQIKTSDVRLSVYVKYCFEIKSWLESVGVNTTPENLNIIIDRVKSQITYLDSVRNNNRNRIEKWSQVLIIPILLAVFSQIIKEQQDLSILFAYTATMLIVIGSFGLVFLNCYNALDFYKKENSNK